MLTNGQAQVIQERLRLALMGMFIGFSKPCLQKMDNNKMLFLLLSRLQNYEGNVFF